MNLGFTIWGPSKDDRSMMGVSVFCRIGGSVGGRLVKGQNSIFSQMHLKGYGVRSVDIKNFEHEGFAPEVVDRDSYPKRK